MQQQPLLAHLNFYLPIGSAIHKQHITFPPELIKIFYIARVIFNEKSTHKIKDQLAPLFSRSTIFSTSAAQSGEKRTRHQQVLVDNTLSIGKMSLVSDISRLIPREHIIYTENIFYKKLLNRELIKIVYQGPREEALSVDRFFSREQAELNKSQKVYLLFDNSTSMNGERFNKIFGAKAIAVEYLRKASLEFPQIYFRSFHSEVGDLHRASTPTELYQLIDYIVHLQTCGGHITNIGDAIQRAIEDINKDPELKEAEILVLTDGFGPVPKDLNTHLGTVKLHVILIPDLDIAKILELYPDRSAWEHGGHDGSRPMPAFWQYYSKEPPPQRLEGDLYEHKIRSYDTAGKSVKELKKQELLQGLHQIYTIREHCENFIFVVITSLFGETFNCTENDITCLEEAVTKLQQRSIETMTSTEKLSFLQTLNFINEVLLLSLERVAKRGLRSKIRALLKIISVLKAQVLADQWILSMLKIDDSRIELKISENLPLFTKDMSLAKAIYFLAKFLWQAAYASTRRILVLVNKISARTQKG